MATRRRPSEALRYKRPPHPPHHHVAPRAQARREPKYELWLCDDCTIAEVNGDYSGMSDTRAEEVAAGIERLVAQVGPLSANWDSETEEGIRDFSSRPCDACGTRLAGSRHRFAAWGRSRHVSETPEPPHPALIEALAADVATLQSDGGFTFEQAYDSIVKPDWVGQYEASGGDMVALGNSVINKAKSIRRARRPIARASRQHVDLGHPWATPGFQETPSEEFARVEVRHEGWSYLAVMYDQWRPSYAGAARATDYFRFDGEWKPVAWNAIPAPAYRRLRAMLRRAEREGVDR